MFKQKNTKRNNTKEQKELKHQTKRATTEGGQNKRALTKYKKGSNKKAQNETRSKLERKNCSKKLFKTEQ